MRELTYLVATSIDGFIAQPDGSHEGFVFDEDYIRDIFRRYPETAPTQFRAHFGIDQPNHQFDTVLMGRKTYEVGLADGVTSPYSHLRQYLISRSMKNSPDSNVELVSGEVAEFVADLKQQGGLGIWLCGGGELASELFSHKLVDRLVIKLNPFVMGNGIPLSTGDIPLSNFSLTDHQTYDNGICLLEYRST